MITEALIAEMATAFFYEAMEETLAALATMESSVALSQDWLCSQSETTVNGESAFPEGAVFDPEEISNTAKEVEDLAVATAFLPMAAEGGEKITAIATEPLPAAALLSFQEEAYFDGKTAEIAGAITEMTEITEVSPSSFPLLAAAGPALFSVADVYVDDRLDVSLAAGNPAIAAQEEMGTDARFSPGQEVSVHQTKEMPVNIHFHGDIRETADVEQIIGEIRRRLAEDYASQSDLSYAF